MFELEATVAVTSTSAPFELVTEIKAARSS